MAVLFVAAFVLRWWWGSHVLATGQYLVASDDGLTYDRMAKILASGSLPEVSFHLGFGGDLYWYFLAAIYRVFGVGNFRVVIAIQAALGSAIPVATYFI